jgi:acyl carrier protein
MTECESFIVEILARRTGLDRAALRPEARLVQDLALDGDDAVDAILEIASRFKIDVSGFRAEFYFRSEPTLPSVFRPFRTPERVLYVRHLIEAADKGVLHSQ